MTTTQPRPTGAPATTMTTRTTVRVETITPAARISSALRDINTTVEHGPHTLDDTTIRFTLEPVDINTTDLRVIMTADVTTDTDGGERRG